MSNIQRINHPPVDEVELFRRQNTEDGFIYHPVAWEDYAGRILQAKETQDFQPIYPLLIRTLTTPHFRYYPLPRLLDNSVVPYYAEDAYQRVQAALNRYVDAKVATRNRYTSDAKVATRIPSFFSKLKSHLFKGK